MTAHLRGEDGAPAGVLNGHIPLRRMGRPNDIAGVIVFLASTAGAYITGAEIPVDGGIVGCR
jgi:NAD(P)-dependent dehydrogenase (short-subunit alcohol dehydrogenase family)